MTDAEKAKHLEPVEASSSEGGSSDTEATETPMLAVWLSLAVIVVAGLYGLYLGTSNKPKSNEQGKATSSIHVPAAHVDGCGRLS